MKPTKEIKGYVCHPVTIGERALIDGKEAILTSVVENVISRTDSEIVFETKNTIYRLNYVA